MTTVPPSDKGKPRTGHISFYDNTVDAASGTILRQGEFENASGALCFGQSVNIVVHFNDNEQQVVVPTVAVSPGADGFYSFVVNDGKVRPGARDRRPCEWRLYGDLGRPCRGRPCGR